MVAQQFAVDRFKWGDSKLHINVTKFGIEPLKPFHFALQSDVSTTNNFGAKVVDVRHLLTFFVSRPFR